MKKTLRFLALALVFVMMAGAMFACTPPTGDNGDKPDDGSGEQQYDSIAGEYYLDASELGMPMSWYIKVTEDDNFTIVNKRDYSVEANIKGKGTVGYSQGTYMFIYSDSTPENPKTATFTVENGNLIFSTAVPIGTSTVSPKVEDGVTTNPVALAIGAEEHLGTYTGEYTKEAMGSTVTYSYEITLSYGYMYTFKSSFSMMGESGSRTETGHFKVDGTKITFTTDAEGGTAVEGTIENKKITSAFKLSEMASSAETVTSEFSPYASVAGQYSAYTTQMGVEFYTFLTLNGNGDYKYESYNEAPELQYSESGTFTMNGTAITLTPSTEGAEPITGTVKNHTVSGNKLKLPLAEGTPAASQTFYAEYAQGFFSASASTEGDNPVEYTAFLQVCGNNFMLRVGNSDGEAIYGVEGTFTVSVTMNLTVTTENAIFNTATAAISDNGINLELPFDPDDTTMLGFQFEQVATAWEALNGEYESAKPAPDVA